MVGYSARGGALAARPALRLAEWGHVFPEVGAEPVAGARLRRVTTAE